MSLILKRKQKTIRRSTSAPHHPTVEEFTLKEVSTASAHLPHTKEEEVVHVSPLKMSGKGKSQTWSPEEPRASFSNSAGNVKTAASRARRASRMFRKAPLSNSPNGSRIGGQVGGGEPPAPSATTPPLWFPLVDYLCRAVEQHGADKMGIFRLSANARTVRELLAACVDIHRKQAGEEAMQKLFAQYEGEVDVAASVLKAYLREQTQPLIPTTFHDRFVAVPGPEQLDARLDQLAHLITSLPVELRDILERLMRSLNLIHTRQELNRMDASNLAIVFAPSVLRAETEGLDIMKIRAQCQVIETFILHHDRLFTVTLQQTTPEEKEQEQEVESAEIEMTAEQLQKQKNAHETSSEFERAVRELTGEPAGEEPSHTHMDHKWEKTHISAFSYVSCNCCHKAIYGIRHTAFQCLECEEFAHSKCSGKVGSTCSGKATKQSVPVVVVVPETAWQKRK